jgi:endonuclease/exonuclease/phosphatase (EEP) superfamily protein YafD
LAGLSLLSNLWHLWLPLGLLLALLNAWARNWLAMGLQLGLALSIALYFLGLKQSVAATEAPAASARDAVAASGVGLRLYALNVGDAVAKWPSVAAEIERLKPDVVALEELNPDMAAGLVEALGESYPHRAVFALGVAGRGLLSRFPIVESGLIEGDGERGILECVLEVEGRRLRVHVVHLSLMSALWGLGEATSRDLLVSVERLKRAAAEENTPGLLVGDFNSTESSGLYRRLLKLGLVDGYRRAGGGFAFSFPVDYRYPYIRVPMCVRIDHLFLTEGVSVTQAQLGPDAGSDHLPLQAELWLR